MPSAATPSRRRSDEPSGRRRARSAESGRRRDAGGWVEISGARGRHVRKTGGERGRICSPELPPTHFERLCEETLRRVLQSTRGRARGWAGEVNLAPRGAHPRTPALAFARPSSAMGEREHAHSPTWIRGGETIFVPKQTVFSFDSLMGMGCIGYYQDT